jgi:hypothetical protein
LAGGETPINNSIILYDALKAEFPEFINEIEKRAGTKNLQIWQKMLSFLRVFNTSSSTPTRLEKTQRQLEHPSFSHTARMFLKLILLRGRGGR